jgi:nucleoside-diphosphate-sugar epimerase
MLERRGRTSFIAQPLLPSEAPMIVLVAGADGRLGRRLVRLLVAHGHVVRGLIRTEAQVGAVEAQGATAVVADLHGDVEWAVDGCAAAIFAAGARRRGDFGAIEGGGAAKLAEAADRFELGRFVLCSAIGADEPERRRAPLRNFLEAKQFAERRLRHLNVPWTIVRFGGLTDAPGTGRITTMVDGRNPLTISRDDAAATLIGALERPSLARRLVEVVEGDWRIAEALDAVEPAPLPPVHNSGLGAAQTTNPPPDPAMLFPDAAPLDSDVDYEGDGPPVPEVIDNDDPSPRIP